MSRRRTRSRTVSNGALNSIRVHRSATPTAEARRARLRRRRERRRRASARGIARSPVVDVEAQAAGAVAKQGGQQTGVAFELATAPPSKPGRGRHRASRAAGEAHDLKSERSREPRTRIGESEREVRREARGCLIVLSRARTSCRRTRERRPHSVSARSRRRLRVRLAPRRPDRWMNHAPRETTVEEHALRCRSCAWLVPPRFVELSKPDQQPCAGVERPIRLGDRHCAKGLRSQGHKCGQDAGAWGRRGPAC